MQSFGTEEYGNKNEFKIVCCNCGKEARLVPTHYYEDGDYKNPKSIGLTIPDLISLIAY